MTAATLTLADFLLARIAEDEAAWTGGTELVTRPDFARLSRHMLTECEAKRRIVERHNSDDWDFACEVEGAGRPDPDQCPDLRALAAVYADHPDYRDEWRI